MTKSEIIKLERNVLDFVQDKFQGKKDKGGTDYIQHLCNVSLAVEAEGKQKSDWYDYGETSSLSMFYHKAAIVALLHDVLEDTDATARDLKELGCDDEIINAVVAITRKTDEQYYFDFIERLNKNDIARLVKIKDLEHNMDIRRLNKFGDYEQNRLKKYWYCWKYLKGEISSLECNNTIHPNRKFR